MNVGDTNMPLPTTFPNKYDADDRSPSLGFDLISTFIASLLFSLWETVDSDIDMVYLM